jgi:Cation efflux family
MAQQDGTATSTATATATAMGHGHEHGHEDRPGHGHGHGHEHEHGHGSGVGRRVRHALSELTGGHSQDAADQIDDALEADQAGRRALVISLGGLGLAAVLQAVAVVFTGSVALLGDTLHDAADALTAVPLLVAFALARRSATKRFTYGYGRAEDLVGLFVVAMIALSSVLAAYEAVRRLVSPQGVDHVWAVAVAGLIGFAGNEWSAATGSASAGRSARPRSSPTGCTPAPTGSPAWPCCSAPAASRSAGSGPTRSSAC